MLIFMKQFGDLTGRVLECHVRAGPSAGIGGGVKIDWRNEVYAALRNCCIAMFLGFEKPAENIGGTQPAEENGYQTPGYLCCGHQRVKLGLEIRNTDCEPLHCRPFNFRT
jgi:hypothetical protein